MKYIKMNIRHILIMPVMLLLTAFTLSAQQQKIYTIKGTVYDEKGLTLPGVTIYLKNQPAVGTTTDVEGKFSIKASHGDMIVFQYLGFENVEYLVTEEKQNLEIKFSTAAKQLDEVVVTALGQTTRKISSVAAISSVDTKDLQVPVASVANLLGGRIAGVISLQNSGEPGKNISEFWIRGIGTFGANSSALVLIDGLEGDINSIDPADIESFSVLKDASATAVYGVRGANGVVLITTKRGESGKLVITTRASVTFEHLTRVPKYLRAYDYAKLANEAMQVRGELPVYSPVELDIIRDHSDPDMYPDVSWQDEILRRNFWKQNYYVSAKGGAKAAKYFVSVGGSGENAAYKYDKGSVYAANTGYNTYNYRLNLDLELSPTTTMYFGSEGFLSVKNNPGVANTDLIWQAQALLNPLLLPTRYSNGQYPAVGQGAMTSPTVMINHMGRRSDQEYKGKSTIALNQEFTGAFKGLKFRIQGAYDIQSMFKEQRLLLPPLYQAVDRNAKGELVTILRVPEFNISYGYSTNQYRKYYLESTLTYEKVISDVHRVGGLIYYSISDEKKARNDDNNPIETNLSAIPKRYQGVSGRVNYGFRDTYMIDLNFGYNGTENFQPGRQYGFFPSIALGWVLSSYQYVKDHMEWMNLFKIRGSYGTVGNDRITDRRFPYLSTMTNGYAYPWSYPNVSQYIFTVKESAIGADNLEWEKATKADLGIEGGFLKNRLSFVVDIFNDVRDRIFQPRVQVPQYAGLVTMPYGNVGKMRSYGTDGNISYMHELNSVSSFTIRGNYTISKNNVIDWEEAYPKYPYLELGGYPLNAVRGYQSLGLFKDQHDIDTSPRQTFGPVMPGDIKYRDVNGDGRIDADDRVPLGFTPIPILMYGFGGEYRYKQLTIGVMFQGTGNTDVFRVAYSDPSNYPDPKVSNNGSGYVPFINGVMGNVLTLVNDPKNRWIPMDYAIANGIDPSLAENPNAMFPRLYYGYNSNNTQLSDFWKTNSRYLRLKEITINYNLRNRLLRKIGVSSIDLQLIGRDLFSWDKIKIFDPEQAKFNGNAYPIPATYALQVYINM